MVQCHNKDTAEKKKVVSNFYFFVFLQLVSGSQRNYFPGAAASMGKIGYLNHDIQQTFPGMKSYLSAVEFSIMKELGALESIITNHAAAEIIKKNLILHHPFMNNNQIMELKRCLQSLANDLLKRGCSAVRK